MVILVALVWPKRPWFPKLLELIVDHPLELPLREDLLTQGPQLVHLDPSVFRLLAFKLSSNPSLREDFLDKLRQPLPSCRETALCQPMRTSGQSSVIGVVDGILIPSISLLHNYPSSSFICLMKRISRLVLLVFNVWLLPPVKKGGPDYSHDMDLSGMLRTFRIEKPRKLRQSLELGCGTWGSTVTPFRAIGDH